MSKGAASESLLGQLHERVAKVMLDALDRYAKFDLDDIVLGDPDGNGMVTVSIPEPSAALLGAITKFLKDNDITCQIEESKEMSDLEKRLQAKGDTTAKVVQLRQVAQVEADDE
jgi:hypothetical protein